MPFQTINTVTRYGISVDVDAYTGEVLLVTDALTGQPARWHHSAPAIAAAKRFATESVLSLAELG